MDDKAEPAENALRRPNFLRDIVEADLAAGRHAQVVTRFPPEPNGYLHIGHALAIQVSHDLAREFGGVFNLRFDDTNPVTEEERFVEAIASDIAWLGCAWDAPVRHASDYFEFMFAAALTLVRKGLAYVDDQTQDEIAEGRGTITEPGRNGPFRDRPTEENLDLLARMRAGEFPDGSKVLRAKIDMTSPDMLMRDPILYRIRHASHHRTGDAWCIYPLYDFAHCLEDACEGVTHSLCSLEFETRRPLYDWILDNVLEGDALASRPHQHEFGRTSLEYTITSKRKLLQLVREGHLSGWDDPRAPTLAGMRRRGVTADAIRAFGNLVGVPHINRLVDIGKLEYSLREDLNAKAPRVMCVIDPLPVEITTWDADRVEEIDAALWPHDVPNEGSRTLRMRRHILIDREDFADEPPKGWHRLAPGREVRLRHAYVIRVDDVERDDDGTPTRLLCSHDNATRDAQPVGRKVRGTIHWVSAEDSLPCEVRLYDRLFVAPTPGAEQDFILDLNPESLVVKSQARVESCVAADPAGSHYQFERQGYFVSDTSDSRPDALVFNRTVTLRDTWSKIVKKRAASSLAAAEPAPKSVDAPPADAGPATPQTTVADERVRARAASPLLSDAYSRYTTEWGLAADDAERLTGDEALVAFFDAAVAENGDAAAVARWAVNELLREVKESSAADLPFDGAAFGRLVGLVETGVVTAAAGKDVLGEMVTSGGEPAEIVERRGLRQMKDTDALRQAALDVIAANPDHVTRYREGKTSLLGFFMGQMMRATKGKANPALTQDVLERLLGGTDGE